LAPTWRLRLPVLPGPAAALRRSLSAWCISPPCAAADRWCMSSADSRTAAATRSGPMPSNRRSTFFRILSIEFGNCFRRTHSALETGGKRPVLRPWCACKTGLGMYRVLSFIFAAVLVPGLAAAGEYHIISREVDGTFSASHRLYTRHVDNL